MTQTAPNPIELKGFILGYMHKQAATPGVDPITDDAMNNREYGTTPEATTMSNPPGMGGAKGAQGNMGQLGSILRGVAPGAAAGAAVAGGGSALMDAIRGKPVHIKRALILAMGLGLPAGAIAQLLHGSATGGANSLGNFGRSFGGAVGDAYGTAKDKLGQGTEAVANKFKDTRDAVGDAKSTVSDAAGKAKKMATTAGANIKADVTGK